MTCVSPSVSTTTPELSFCDKFRVDGVFATAHHTMNLAGYPGVTSPSARPPVRRAPGRRQRTRIRGSCLRRHIRWAEPHHLARLPAPQRRPRSRTGRPPRRRAHLPHRRTQRARHRIPRAELTHGHPRRRAEPFCRSRPPSLRWRATSLASVCGRAPSPPGRADGKGAPHRDSRAATLRSESLGRPRPLDPRYQLWSRRPHSARARSTTASLSAERSRVRASGCLPHEVASSAAPRHGAMEEQRR